MPVLDRLRQRPSLTGRNMGLQSPRLSRDRMSMQQRLVQPYGWLHLASPLIPLNEESDLTSRCQLGSGGQWVSEQTYEAGCDAWTEGDLGFAESVVSIPPFALATWSGEPLSIHPQSSLSQTAQLIV